MDQNRRIVILFFHPLYHKSRVNRELIRTAEGVEGVNVRFMYDLYPDFFIDRKVEQQVLLDHDLIIWQHPLYWYSSPSLLKEWMDIVLEHGFAYGRKGEALAGKKIMSALTIGGNREVYTPQGARKHTLSQLLVPFSLTADLCHLDYLPPFTVHGTHLLDRKGALAAAEEYRKLLLFLRDPESRLEKLAGYDYMNDYLNKS